MLCLGIGTICEHIGVISDHCMIMAVFFLLGWPLICLNYQLRDRPALNVMYCILKFTLLICVTTKGIPRAIFNFTVKCTTWLAALKPCVSYSLDLLWEQYWTVNLAILLCTWIPAGRFWRGGAGGRTGTGKKKYVQVKKKFKKEDRAGPLMFFWTRCNQLP